MRRLLQAAGRSITPLLLAPRRRDRAWSQWLYLRLYLAAKAIGERDERRFLRSLVRPGDVVLDVGANVGFFTVELARWVGRMGHVHAFEPDPLSVALLRRRCRALPQVSVVAAAIGAEDGTCVLHLSATNRADNRLHAPDAGGGERVEVPLVTLDAYCAQAGIARLDVVKMDVQGSEVAALRGFATTLARLRPRALIVEVSPEHLRGAGTSAIELLALLRAAGYAPWTCEPRHAAPIADDAAFAAAWEHGYTDVWARRLPLDD
jgi:FkbM family methyltransferase